MEKRITIITVITIITIIISTNYQLYRNYTARPAGSTYLGATGFFFDYYQFLSWMRDGSEGKFLITSRYISEAEKPVLLHPLFPVLGFIGGRMGLSLPVTYHLFRNLFLGLFLASLYLLVRAVFNKIKYQRLAYLTILLSGAFPHISLNNGGVSLGPMIPFWQTFYALQKFDIPAHHLLSKSLFVILIFLIIYARGPLAKARSLLAIVLVSVLLVLVNPASMTFLLAVLGIYLLVLFLQGDPLLKQGVSLRYKFIIVFLSALPFMLYNYHIFTSLNPWKYYYYGEKVGRYMVSFWAYLWSLGPLFLSSFLSLKYFRKFGFAEKLLMIWNFLPVLMFPFVGRQMPFSMSRLFSVDLFIPSSLLTVYFFRNLLARGPLAKARSLLAILLATALILSLGLGISYSAGTAFSYKFKNYYNVFLPKELVSAIDYINNNGRGGATILAGENLSNLLPAVTSNRVVWGRQDAYADYNRVENRIHDIYLRKIDDKEIYRRLKEWNVQYIIFGIDHVGYDRFVSGGKIEGIEEVFRNGEIVIAEVK